MHSPEREAAGQRATHGLGLGILALVALRPVAASAVEYHVDTSQQNEVRFISDAPVEDFEGVTPKIDGYVFWEGDSLIVESAPKKSELYFEVPLNTLKTGIDMRDRHMRENYLHTEEHPYVSYKGEITAVQQAGGDTLKVSTKGRLDLHGGSKDYAILCTLVPTPSGFSVAAQFDIRLPEFDIEVPSLMFLKINELIQVLVQVHVAPAK